MDSGPDRTAGVSTNQARRANRDARWFLGLLRCGHAAGLAGSARRDPLRSNQTSAELGRPSSHTQAERAGKRPGDGRRAANSPPPPPSAEVLAVGGLVTCGSAGPLVPARARWDPLVTDAVRTRRGPRTLYAASLGAC